MDAGVGTPLIMAIGIGFLHGKAHIDNLNVVNKYNKYPNATLIAQLLPVVAQVTHEIAQTSKYYSADWYANRNFDPVLYPIVDGKWTKTNPFTGKSVQQVA